MCRRFGIVLVFIALLIAQFSTLAQDTDTSPCGVVDGFDYPIDISDTLERRYDDFSRFRARFEGRHVGLDVAFNRWGDPVRAAARGRVTLADLEEWDTEKGVVILEHTFPDGSVAYTLYGHVERTDTYNLPEVGSCVGRGDIIGAVGYPSRGAPHLHYEIRSILPYEGGPGYVTENPLELGWYHPLDFTQQWRARLTGGLTETVRFDLIPSLPPVTLDSGMTVIASVETIVGVTPDGSGIWRITAGGVINGLAALPGDRVVARSRDGVVYTLQGGRYIARWDVPGLDEPFHALTHNSVETLIFLTEGGGLAAFDPSGTSLWTLAAPISGGRVVAFDANGLSVSVGVQTDDGTRWRVVNANGQITFETTIIGLVTSAPLADGTWLKLNGTALYRVVGADRAQISTISPPPGRTARMTTDILGNIYVYMGDSDGTLLALTLDGAIRWRVNYPVEVTALAPVLAVGGGCVLYSLDADGMLNAFSASDGALISQMQLYAGGADSSSPRARLLRADLNDRLQVGAGFLSASVVDGRIFAADAFTSCRVG